jgi:lipid-binding SYLF domain-containing protein
MKRSRICLLLLVLVCASCATGPGGTHALPSHADAQRVDQKARAALDRLYASNPKARSLGARAVGVLVFPDIIKGGIGIGGAWGDGALFLEGRPTTYFRSISASYGLQLGIQKYGYAVFFVDEASVRALTASQGWEIGSSPNVVVVDKGIAEAISTTTMEGGTYAIFFNQRGLMAGLSLEGTKITRLAPRR